MEKIGTLNIQLENACTDKTCYWHTSHWGNFYRSGCYMLTDASKCNGYHLPLKEGLRKEKPDLFRQIYGEEP